MHYESTEGSRNGEVSRFNARQTCASQIMNQTTNIAADD